MPAANDNKSEGEWVVTFIPTRFLAALDKYMGRGNQVREPVSGTSSCLSGLVHAHGLRLAQ